MAHRSSRFDLGTRLLSWWYNQKNKIIKNIHVQDFLARFPITSRIARKEGEAIFQLMTGFVDTQILFTFVKSGALRHLESGSLSIEDVNAQWKDRKITSKQKSFLILGIEKRIYKKILAASANWTAFFSTFSQGSSRSLLPKCP